MAPGTHSSAEPEATGFAPGPFFSELLPALTRADFAVTIYGRAAGWPLVCAERPSEDSPVIYLSAGIHGDEPAGPAAMLDLLRRDALSRRVHWLLFPALNPGGLERGIRENPGGFDLNRHYRDTPPETPETLLHLRHLEARGPDRFAAALCLHEDWEASGGYLYELNPDEHPSAAPAILEAFATTCGVESAEIIDGWPTRGPGLIRTPDHPEERQQWPEAIYLIAKRTRYSLTTETPSSLPLARRVAAQAAAVEALTRHLTPAPETDEDRQP